MGKERSEAGQMWIVGAGSYGPVVAELAATCGYAVAGYLDDRPEKWGSTIQGHHVKGPIGKFLNEFPKGENVAIAIGHSVNRYSWLQQAWGLGLRTPSLISHKATISPSAKIEEGCAVHAGSHVWTEAVIGRGTILSPLSTIAHHTTTGAACLVSTGANVGASVSVGDFVMVGIGATISTGVSEVGDHVILGAGSVLIRNAPSGGTYAGVPARLIERRQS